MIKKLFCICIVFVFFSISLAIVGGLINEYNVKQLCKSLDINTKLDIKNIKLDYFHESPHIYEFFGIVHPKKIISCFVIVDNNEKIISKDLQIN